MLTFFFFNDTATTEIYTLSLHDALPICEARNFVDGSFGSAIFTSGPMSTSTSLSPAGGPFILIPKRRTDRKSTRLNSSHSQISYAVFCLKKKKQTSLLIVCTLAEQIYMN